MILMLLCKVKNKFLVISFRFNIAGLEKPFKMCLGNFVLLEPIG